MFYIENTDVTISNAPIFEYGTGSTASGGVFYLITSTLTDSGGSSYY
jgi:hypothetical protein